MKETLEQLFTPQFTANFFILILESIVLSFLVIIIINSTLMTALRKKRLEKAIKKGHCLIAKRTRFVYNVEGIHSKASNYTGYYHYYYKERKYKCYFYYDDLPPEEIKVYFANNPKKAKPEELFGFLENEKYLIFLICLIVMCLIKFAFHVDIIEHFFKNGFK